MPMVGCAQLINTITKYNADPLQIGKKKKENNENKALNEIRKGWQDVNYYYYFFFYEIRINSGKIRIDFIDELNIYHFSYSKQLFTACQTYHT